MNRLGVVISALAFALAVLSLPVWAAKRGFRADTGTYTGDFDQMQKRGVLRVAVPFSRTQFFYDKGQQHGLAADAIHSLEVRLRRDFPGKRPITVVITPMTFDRLLPALVEGKADVAAGSITVTEERRKDVDFTVPITDSMIESVVTGPGAPELFTLEDLSGQEVHVRGATSYRQSLDSLSARLVKQGKAPVTITLLPDELSEEDVLDMLNVGLIRITVKDDRLVELWKDFLPGITLRDDLVLRENGTIAWAVRKKSPKLKAVLDSIIPDSTRLGLQDAAYIQFARDAKKMRNARGDADMRRFEEMVGLFRKYGGQYGFDSLLLMAQGYQESALDQDARSPSGAIGVMQIMPATARTLAVGDIRQVEPNIHGGAKYLAGIMDKHFKDASFSETNRALFAFASYNISPARVARLRAKARKHGLDPNVWFNNVEVVVAREQGQTPVRYVRNIFKYYVAYKLEEEARARRDTTLRKAERPAPAPADPAGPRAGPRLEGPGQAHGPEHLGTVLPVELLGPQDLGVGQLGRTQDQADTSHDVGHEGLFGDRGTVLPGVAVQEDVPGHGPALGPGKEVQAEEGVLAQARVPGGSGRAHAPAGLDERGPEVPGQPVADARLETGGGMGLHVARRGPEVGQEIPGQIVAQVQALDAQGALPGEQQPRLVVDLVPPALGTGKAHEGVVIVLGLIRQGRRADDAQGGLEGVQLGGVLGVQGQGKVGPARIRPVSGLGLLGLRVARGVHVLAQGKPHVVLLARLVHEGQDAQVRKHETRQPLVVGVPFEVPGNPGQLHAVGVALVRAREKVVLFREDERGSCAGGRAGLVPEPGSGGSEEKETDTNQGKCAADIGVHLLQLLHKTRKCQC
jgi:membrane-bound lytic murein transglycosylase MltF